MHGNLFLQTYFTIHGFIVIEVHYVITKYSKNSACEKGQFKSIGFSNIFSTDA